MIEKTGIALILPGAIFVLSLIVIYYGWRTGDRAAVLAAGSSWFYVIYHMQIIQSAIKHETEAKTTRYSTTRSNRRVNVDRKNIDRQPTADDEIDEQEIIEAELQP